MNNRFLISLAAGMAASRVVQTLNQLTADDVLCSVGLQRRRSTAVENAALIGLGVFLGAGTALMLAPTDGEQTRRKVADGFGKAREAGMRLVNDAKARAPEIFDSAKYKLSDADEVSSQYHHS